MTLKKLFDEFAKHTAQFTGHASAFAAAVAVIVIWGITGPLFGFSDTWQLVINTSTTIITFLMVFLIQHSQNRDNAAIQAKLSELIRSTKEASDALIDLEDMDEEELERCHHRFMGLAAQARAQRDRLDRDEKEISEIERTIQSASSENTETNRSTPSAS